MFHLTHNTSFWGRRLQSTTSTNSVKALKDKKVCWEIQDWYHENLHDEKSSDNTVTIYKRSKPNAQIALLCPRYSAAMSCIMNAFSFMQRKHTLYRMQIHDRTITMHEESATYAVYIYY